MPTNNLILKGENAVFAECGYSCDNVLFIQLGGRKFFLTDARYTLEASACVRADVEVIDAGRGLIKCARLLLRRFGVARIDYDPREFSVAEFEALSRGLGINFKQRVNFSQLKRQIKTEREVEILREAAEFGAICFDEFAKFVRQNGEGMSERELHFNAELIFKQKNKFGLSFSPIVAINENAAKAHALPSEKCLNKGDLLLLDAGVRWQNYCSDRTRTACFDENFNFSKEQKFADPKQQEIYNIVRKAQECAIAAVKIGATASDIDAAARDVINAAGYGKFFIHSTGHGVGIDIHELPVISTRADAVLQKGMVFSVEPGIYLPGEFGVRIEDVVVVGDNGAEIL